MNIRNLVGILFMLAGLLSVLIGIKITFVPMDVMADTESMSYSSKAMLCIVLGGLSVVTSMILLTNIKKPK